jgi:hypothetical protein
MHLKDALAQQILGTFIFYLELKKIKLKGLFFKNYVIISIEYSI